MLALSIKDVVKELELKMDIENETRFIFEFHTPLKYILEYYKYFIQQFLKATEEEKEKMIIPRAVLSGIGMPFFSIEQKVALSAI